MHNRWTLSFRDTQVENSYNQKLAKDIQCLVKFYLVLLGCFIVMASVALLIQQFAIKLTNDYTVEYAYTLGYGAVNLLLFGLTLKYALLVRFLAFGFQVILAILVAEYLVALDLVGQENQVSIL